VYLVDLKYLARVGNHDSTAGCGNKYFIFGDFIESEVSASKNELPFQHEFDENLRGRTVGVGVVEEDPIAVPD
jgi:hypothetical protein